MTRPKRPKARLTPKQKEMIKELEARFEALPEALTAITTLSWKTLG